MATWKLYEQRHVTPTEAEWPTYGYGDYAKVETTLLDTVEAPGIRQAQAAFRRRHPDRHLRFAGKFARYFIEGPL